MGAIRRWPQAEEDLIEIWVYIARSDPAAADRVLDAIEQTLRLLADTPEMGVRHISSLKRLADVRFFPAKRFRHFLIYYQPAPDGIEVIRVLRGERDRTRLLEEDR